MSEEKEKKTDPLDNPGKEPVRRNWVTDLYDRANLSVRQLNIMLIALLALIVILFVAFGK